MRLAPRAGQCRTRGSPIRPEPADDSGGRPGKTGGQAGSIPGDQAVRSVCLQPKRPGDEFLLEPIQPTVVQPERFFERLYARGRGDAASLCLTRQKKKGGL